MCLVNVSLLTPLFPPLLLSFPSIFTYHFCCFMIGFLTSIPAKRENEGRGVCQEVAGDDDWRGEAAHTDCTRPSVDNWWTWGEPLLNKNRLKALLLYLIPSVGIEFNLIVYCAYLAYSVTVSQCLIKPTIKECTKPIDLKLHSDVRAVERAEFDHQVRCWVHLHLFIQSYSKFFIKKLNH